MAASAAEWIASDSIEPEPETRKAPNFATVRKVLPTTAARTAVLELAAMGTGGAGGGAGGRRRPRAYS